MQSVSLNCPVQPVYSPSRSLQDVKNVSKNSMFVVSEDLIQPITTIVAGRDVVGREYIIEKLEDRYPGLLDNRTRRYTKWAIGMAMTQIGFEKLSKNSWSRPKRRTGLDASR